MSQEHYCVGGKTTLPFSSLLIPSPHRPRNGSLVSRPDRSHMMGTAVLYRSILLPSPRHWGRAALLLYMQGTYLDI